MNNNPEFEKLRKDIQSKLKQPIDNNRMLNILMNTFKDHQKLNKELEITKEKLHAMENHIERLEAEMNSSTNKKW